MFIARLALSFALEGDKYCYHRSDRQVHRTPTCQSNSRQGLRNFRQSKHKSPVNRISLHRTTHFPINLLDNIDPSVFASTKGAKKYACLQMGAYSIADHSYYAKSFGSNFGAKIK